MKVVAINSSPMMDMGNTALILNPFLEGMRNAGAEVELYYTKKLEIKPCQGEFNCWFKTPGKCFQKDDMQMLDPKMRSADILVFATPIYCDGATGPLKNLMDRTVQQVQPFFELRDDHCRHPLREDTKASKVVLVSNCGLWEMDNFDPLIMHMKAYCRNGANEFAGALLRPHGPALKPMMEMGVPLNDIFEAAKEAGRQLVEDGKMSIETLNIVSRELLPREKYIQIVNQHFQQELDALEKK
ncbi:MAG TPA: flavodoxin family protein [Candidatus Methanoperedens sp.]|nr:flavodoxin family protein [Candidatus Methanoperedens sp.]HLB70696.1 flavodoxin family protein [Candidatus Methanoperedens sp.]